MTEDAPPPESPTQATFTIKEKCTILGISSSSFDRYRKLGMPSSNIDEAKSWIQQKRVTLKEKSQKLGISLSSFKEYKKLGMPTDDPDEAMSWIQQKRRRRWYSFRAKSRHTMLRLRRISREGWKRDGWDASFQLLTCRRR